MQQLPPSVLRSLENTQIAREQLAAEEQAWDDADKEKEIAASLNDMAIDDFSRRDATETEIRGPHASGEGVTNAAAVDFEKELQEELNRHESVYREHMRAMESEHQQERMSSMRVIHGSIIGHLL